MRLDAPRRVRFPCGVPITELRLEGLRTIEKIRLPLEGLTVLIGDNGTGKSSILEACELLRRATGPRFIDDFYGIHGGLPALLRQGASRLVIAVTVRGSHDELNLPAPEDAPDLGEGALEYELALVSGGTFARIEETLRSKESVSAPSWKQIAARRGGQVVTQDGKTEEIDQHLTLLAKALSPANGGSLDEWWIIEDYLRRILVHLPFETTPAWAARALDRKSALRSSALLTPADHLEKLGLNLASAYHALKNSFGRDHWDHTLEYLRLGLGERIEDVVSWADPGGGNIGLSVKLSGLDLAIPSSQISDGMLSYLAFVALFRLHTTKPSLVAFDEPDLHLHPQLLMRVLDMFESMARESPVLLATHSDRLLDGLTDPAKSVVLCELDERGATRLVRPDANALAKWLERYRGLGDIRGAGHAASVLTKIEPA
jgi:predicted ATPase